MIKRFINWIKAKLYRRKMIKFAEYYRSRPVEFCEEFLGLEFLLYQKRIFR